MKYRLRVQYTSAGTWLDLSYPSEKLMMEAYKQFEQQNFYLIQVMEPMPPVDDERP